MTNFNFEFSTDDDDDDTSYEDIIINDDDDNFLNNNLYSYAVEVFENLHLTRDIRSMTLNFNQRSVRDLVSTYYDLQDLRIMTNNRTKALQKSGSPHELVEYYTKQLKNLEVGLVKPLDNFAKEFVVGRWAQSQYGIGPVISAGLLAHIDISKAPTAGSVWRYAGLDPTIKWNKGEKRPFNAALKTLTWKIGQSFLKFHNRDQCFYGHLYKMDKNRRVEKNNNGDYAEAAANVLATKNIRDKKTRSILESGMLPDGQIDAQARRFAVKIFLSHYHAVAYQEFHGKPAPRPYIIEHGGHVHEIAIPNFPF